MIRIAKEIGKIEGTNIIVTGDILGEQASQTLDNLYAYNNLLEDFIILRPLIGKNKLEIIKMNEKITFIGHTMDRGGASRVLSILANNYAKTAKKVDLVFFHIKNEYDISDKVKLVGLFEKNEKISLIKALYRLQAWPSMPADAHRLLER